MYIASEHGPEIAEEFIRCSKDIGISKEEFMKKTSTLIPNDLIEHSFETQIKRFVEKYAEFSNSIRVAGCNVRENKAVGLLQPGEITHVHVVGRFKGVRVGRNSDGKYFVAIDGK